MFLVIKLRKRRSIRRNWRLRPMSTETWNLGWLGRYGAIIALILTLRKEKKTQKKRLRRRQISPICQIETSDPWIWVWRLVQFNHCAWKLWFVEERSQRICWRKSFTGRLCKDSPITYVTCKRTQQHPTMLGVVASVCTGLKVWPVSNFAQLQFPITRNNKHATGCANGSNM